jgi:hypothetical protein
VPCVQVQSPAQHSAVGLRGGLVRGKHGGLTLWVSFVAWHFLPFFLHIIGFTARLSHRASSVVLLFAELLVPTGSHQNKLTDQHA